MQNTYRYLATKQIKQILNPNRHNTHHKRKKYSINQIKRILESNNLIKKQTNMCCHITILPFYQHCRFYKYLNILIIEWKQLNEEVNERIHDDDLERLKHVGLFLIKVF